MVCFDLNFINLNFAGETPKNTRHGEIGIRIENFSGLFSKLTTAPQIIHKFCKTGCPFTRKNRWNSKRCFRSYFALNRLKTGNLDFIWRKMTKIMILKHHYTLTSVLNSTRERYGNETYYIQYLVGPLLASKQLRIGLGIEFIRFWMVFWWKFGSDDK